MICYLLPYIVMIFFSCDEDLKIFLDSTYTLLSMVIFLMGLSVVGDFGWLHFGANINYVLVDILAYLFWHASTSPNSRVSQRKVHFKF